MVEPASSVNVKVTVTKLPSAANVFTMGDWMVVTANIGKSVSVGTGTSNVATPVLVKTVYGVIGQSVSGGFVPGKIVT